MPIDIEIALCNNSVWYWKNIIIVVGDEHTWNVSYESLVEHNIVMSITSMKTQQMGWSQSWVME